jgi:alpha-L-fucosidase
MRWCISMAGLVGLLCSSWASEPSAARTNAEALRGWQDAKFGLFVHWAPASLTGKELSWSRGGARPELPGLREGEVPREEYDALYQQFNPVQFDARAWVALAREAGMKYLVFTTKHHDGFCMFDSALTDYDIMASPYGKDIVAELAAACHEADFGFGLYYSLPDWYHPAYKTDRHGEYINYLHGQVHELLTRYGRVDELWFDGKQQGTAETWDSARLVPEIRRLQPQILINDRIWGETDFDTPEQVIGRFSPERPWESCITVGQQWSWKPDEPLKTWQECVRLLALTVGGGGNLLLNVGPMPDGRIEDRQATLLREIGAWLDEFGEAIYETLPGPFPTSFWGASTRRDDTIYLLLLEGWERELQLPAMDAAVRSSRVLGGGEAEIDQTAGLTVRVSAETARPPVTIVELTLDRPASTVPFQAPELSIPAGTTARAPNVRRNEANYGPNGAVDDNPLSRWATDDGITETWLEITFPAAIRFDVMTMDEAFGSRIQAFELQQRVDSGWETFYAGTTVGRNWAARFEPVTARELRLRITRATDGPTIRDIQFRVLGGGDR